ncbi:MAG TPA: HYR domain-containing protein [Opitutus sp.]|nr:HYR domain-containing protein [Opitutus sp.]
MKNRIGRSTGAFNWRTFVFLLAGLALGCVTRAATQTLTILGANGVAGSVEPNTDYSKDGGVTWHPAYLFTGHPWGYISGTNAWLNQDPSPFVGLNERVDFRVRFYAPSTWTNAQMTYTVNADNEADILLNGTLIAHTIGGVTPTSGAIPTQYLVPGLNILYVRLIDYGGWVGLNYRIDLSMEADSPLQLLTPPPSITSALSATDTVNGPFNYTITATNSPTSFAASNLPAGLTVNPANGVISGAPTAAGTYNILLSASSAFGTGSDTLVLAVNKTPAGVTLGSLTQTYDGTVKSATATTSPAGLPVAFTYTGANLPPVNAGSYGVIGVIDSPAYIGSASDTLLINPAPATIILGNLAQSYDGSPKTVSVATTPAGLATTTTYNGSATAPTAVGAYAVATTVANPNYTGSASATLTISDTTKPVLTLPTSPIVVEATNSAGAVVTFTATANDNVNGAVPVTLTPASGSLFPIGTTLVTATATDAAGNTATGTFTVKVHSLTVTTDKPTVTVKEGAVAANSGTFNDSDAVTVTVSASKGAVAQTATGVWTYQQTLSPGGQPIELSLDSDDNLYVVDENNTVYKYDSSGVLVTTWAVGGAPKGIAVDNVNHVVYVVSTGNNRVEKYTLTGALISTLGTTGSGDGQFSNPYCVAVDSSGNVYVTDTGNARIEVFNSSGAFLRKWGGAGGGDGQFNFNQGIRVSASGRVYVADRNNYRVQYFDTNGNFLGKWGTPGSGAGQFNQPAGVGIDPSGNVYVGDIFNGRVQKFTADGTFVDQFGPGTGTGALNQPHGTVFPQAGRSIYIASWASGVVQKYTTPGTWSWSYAAPVGSVGSSTVNVTATNANGIVSTTSFNLVVLDATPPALTLPANQTLEATSAAGAIATFAATATDAITASPAIAYSQASGSVFPIGATPVTVTATDAAGNVATGTFTITVRDTTAPAIAPLSDLVTEATGATGAVVTFGTTASDTVSGNVAVVASPAAGSTFPLGTTVVTLHATDAAGNVGSSTFQVVVRDTTAPTLTLPANQTLEATGAAGASATFAASATDAVSTSPAIVYSVASGATFPLGSTTVNVTATDAAGNSASGSFTITVQDTSKPALTIPTSPIIAEATGPEGAAVTFTTSATDAVSGDVLVTTSAASGSTFPLGDTVVTAQAQDAAGNVATGTFTITVRDTTAPVISTAPPEPDLFAETFDAYSGGIQDAPQYLSNLQLSYSGNLPNWTKAGLHAIHAVNLTGTGNFAVMIYNDNVITSTQSVAANDSGTAYVVKFSAGPAVYATPSQATAAGDGLVVDLLRADNSVAFSFTYKPGAYAGSSTLSPVVFTYTGDGTGALHPRIRSLLLEGRFAGVIDNLTIAKQPTVLSAPSDLTLEATSAAGAVATFNAVATDLVSGNVAVTASPASGSTFPLGTTTVSLTATDAHGNVANRSFTVTVADTTAPVLTLPASQTLEAASAAGAIATFAASATDAVGATITYSAASGSSFPLGATTVNVTATDAAGNRSSGAFTITVRDTTPPVIDVPANIVTEATGAAGAAATFSTSATDLVDGNVAVSSSVASGSTFPLGTTPVTLTATDAAGNTATKVFSITVTDTTAPVIAPQDNLVVEATSAAGAVVAFTPGAVDVVDGAVNVIASPVSGSTFALGTTPVTLTAADAAGNSANATFTVKVVDTTPPVITQPDIVTEATGPAGAAVTFAPTASDLVSGSVSVVSSIPSGSTFAVGTTPVTLTATDAAGNTATKVFSVTVTDTTAPIIAPQDNLVVEATSADGAVVAFTPSALDIVSGAVAVNASPASGSTFPIGTTTVQLAAHDAAGNAAGSSFTVTVQDTTPPTIAIPANIVAEATSAAGAVVNFSPTASDLVDGAVSVTASPASGSVFPLGTTPVTLTSTDAHGNTATSTFTVTVKDTTAPVLTTPANQTLEATGPAGAAATFLASATDAVGASLAYSIAPGSTFPLGTTTVAVTASDAAHNSTSGTFTITVRDTTRPVLSLPADQILEATAATGAVATFSASANDLVSGNLPVGFSPPSGNRFALGTTTVTASATDAAANTATGTFTITVRDTTPPAIAAPADLVQEATGPSGAVATFAATATDIVDGTDTVTASKPSGSTFALGTTTVTLTATDAAQNTSTETFHVTVRDTTAPTINVPADIVVDSATVLGSAVTFTVTASDIVDGSRPVTLSRASGSTFPVGTTTVTATATDAAGNVATRSFEVTVRAPATAAVNQITALNGTINGSIQQLDHYGVTLNGGGAITGELLVVGTPAVRLNGKPGFGGTADFTGSTSPSNYTITLNGGASLGRLVRRVDPVALPIVAAPANPTGSRSVTMNKSTDAIGAWATVRNLTLNGNVGNVAVPAGVYGNFTANGNSGFTLGVAGATTPSVYEFQNLTLNGNTAFNIVGPVIVTVKNTINVNGSMGNGSHPEWFDLRVSDGSVTLNGNVSVYAYVVAPKGTVTINGNSELRGGLAADKLVLNGNSKLTLLLR